MYITGIPHFHLLIIGILHFDIRSFIYKKMLRFFLCSFSWCKFKNVQSPVVPGPKCQFSICENRLPLVYTYTFMYRFIKDTLYRYLKTVHGGWRLRSPPVFIDYKMTKIEVDCIVFYPPDKKNAWDIWCCRMSAKCKMHFSQWCTDADFQLSSYE